MDCRLFGHYSQAVHDLTEQQAALHIRQGPFPIPSQNQVLGGKWTSSLHPEMFEGASSNWCPFWSPLLSTSPHI